MPEPDSILQRIAAGDRAAVGECISRHGGLVGALARRAFPDRADAEDAVQEIFIDLWSNAGRFDPAVATETTFVAMIARRRIIDRRRKLGRRPEPGPLPDSLACTGRGGAPDLDLRDEAEAARRALGELRDDQRRVLLLSIDRGLTYDEIARHTGLALGTVKTHARRGLIRLRELLSAPWGEAATP